jgi:hypothetical protein
MWWARHRLRRRRAERRHDPSRRHLLWEREAMGAGHTQGCLYCGTPWARDCPEPIPF